VKHGLHTGLDPNFKKGPLHSRLILPCQPGTR
jgi:hypothetical protein